MQFNFVMNDRIPEQMTDEEGAMIEPLTVAVYACRRAQVTVGKTVLITGAGPIGLFNIMVAKALGAEQVVVTGNHCIHKTLIFKI
jgi:L-iditol 2-dehydrogenase